MLKLPAISKTVFKVTEVVSELRTWSNDPYGNCNDRSLHPLYCSDDGIRYNVVPVSWNTRRNLAWTLSDPVGFHKNRGLSRVSNRLGKLFANSDNCGDYRGGASQQAVWN